MKNKKEVKNCKDFLEYQLRQNHNRLSRNLLSHLEDIRKRQQQVFKIFPKECDKEVQTVLNISEEESELIRKRILDEINGNLRDILLELEKYNVKFNFDK